MKCMMPYGITGLERVKTLKNAPACFDLIQIIFRELIYSLLKSMILKSVKNVKC